MFTQIQPVTSSQNQSRPVFYRATRMLIRMGLSASLCLLPDPLPAQASPNERSGAQTPQESISLELGKPIERELSGGISHFYKITMVSGQFLRIVVKQQGIDVAVALSTPDGKKIAEADIEHVMGRSETVSLISELAGSYLIEARSPEKTAKPGLYEIKAEELRVAAAEDRHQVAGDVLFREAEHLKDGTLEAKRKAIEKYHEALELYRRASDLKGEANALNNIGAVYYFLGEMQKALEKYNEALPIIT